MQSFLDELQVKIDAEWSRIKDGRFFRTATREFPKELYVKVMTQIYHYTKYNSINQGAAAFSTDHSDPKLLAFGFKHALEELGHEKMVVRDLASIGVPEERIIDSTPFPPTEALNGYLFSVGIRQGMIARLGYSLWAEDSYGHIAPLIESLKKSLGLSDEQLTFFVAHSAIDERHSVDVKNAIRDFVTTEHDQRLVEQVALTTLFLTGRILESCLEY